MNESKSAGPRVVGRVTCGDGVIREVYEDPDGHRWVTGEAGRLFSEWLPRRPLLGISERSPEQDRQARSTEAGPSSLAHAPAMTPTSPLAVPPVPRQQPPTPPPVVASNEDAYYPTARSPACGESATLITSSLANAQTRISPPVRVLIALLFPLAGMAIFWSSLMAYLEAGRHLTPASVSVSGYYRRDGTYVRPYNRRPPGGVTHDAPYLRTRSLCESGMLLGVAVSLVPVIPFVMKRQRTRGSLPAAGVVRCAARRPARIDREGGRPEHGRQTLETALAAREVLEPVDRGRAERLEQWKRSEMPKQWVLENLAGWDLLSLSEFVDRVKATTFWPLDVEDMVAFLNRLRCEFRGGIDRKQRTGGNYQGDDTYKNPEHDPSTNNSVNSAESGANSLAGVIPDVRQEHARPQQELERPQKLPDDRAAELAARRAHWLKVTGLPPPDERRFVPRSDEYEGTARSRPHHDPEKCLACLYQRQMEQEDLESHKAKPKRSRPAKRNETSPYWDNIVRAYEEDR